MKDKDYIQELFSKKLSGHEVPVRSDLWSGIQSQIGSTATTAASGGVSIAAKWVIGIASSVIVAGSVIWFASDESPEQNVIPSVSKLEQPNKISEEREEPLVAKILSSEQERSSQETIKTNNGDGNTRAEVNNNTDINNRGTEAGPQNVAPLIVRQQITKEEASARQDDKKSNTPEKNTNATAAGGSSQNPSIVQQEGSKPVVGKIEEWVNVFSPNGDAVNDIFKLESENLKDFTITVLDEKNQVVYTSSNPGFEWNGMNSKTGEMVPGGNYGYIVIARDVNGNLIKMFKNLTITR